MYLQIWITNTGYTVRTLFWKEKTDCKEMLWVCTQCQDILNRFQSNWWVNNLTFRVVSAAKRDQNMMTVNLHPKGAFQRITLQLHVWRDCCEIGSQTKKTIYCLTVLPIKIMITFFFQSCYNLVLIVYLKLILVLTIKSLLIIIIGLFYAFVKILNTLHP